MNPGSGRERQAARQWEIRTMLAFGRGQSLVGRSSVPHRERLPYRSPPHPRRSRNTRPAGRLARIRAGSRGPARRPQTSPDRTAQITEGEAAARVQSPATSSHRPTCCPGASGATKSPACSSSRTCSPNPVDRQAPRRGWCCCLPTGRPSCGTTRPRPPIDCRHQRSGRRRIRRSCSGNVSWVRSKPERHQQSRTSGSSISTAMDASRWCSVTCALAPFTRPSRTTNSPRSPRSLGSATRHTSHPSTSTAMASSIS